MVSSGVGEAIETMAWDAPGPFVVDIKQMGREASFWRAFVTREGELMENEVEVTALCYRAVVKAIHFVSHTGPSTLPEEATEIIVQGPGSVYSYSVNEDGKKYLDGNGELAAEWVDGHVRLVKDLAAERKADYYVARGRPSSGSYFDRRTA